jgi:hypothetical protein
MRITNYPRKKIYTSIKNKAAAVSSALSTCTARDAVSAYRKIQSQEAQAREAWSNCTDFWSTSKAFQVPAQSWTRALGKLIKVTAQLAGHVGVSGAQDILDFDAGDVLSQAKNLEVLFESKKLKEFAQAIEFVRTETARNTKQYEIDRRKFVSLNDRLDVVLSKLNIEIATGLLALKNNKIPVPKRAVKTTEQNPVEKTTETKVESEVTS